MHGQNYLDYLAYACALSAAVTVGRANLKKHIIEDLKTLVLAHEKTIVQLKKDNADKDERICALEETVDGYAELVREGHIAGGSGATSRNRATPSKIAKNRTP